MKFLLDTNICIAFLHRAESKIVERFQQKSPEEIFLCSIVKAELYYGAEKSQKSQQNLAHLESFFEGLTSLTFDDKASKIYGSKREYLRKKGTLIGNNDLLIASIALAHDLTLVTRNEKEFRRIPDLVVDVW